MKKNKGFTLIELIAVVVMMGMILLIVFPAMSRLLKSNENKKFDMYYDSVLESLELYARTRRDELGGIEGEGCAEDKKLSELRSYDYIPEYKEEKNVSCLSPGDFTTEQLTTLGIDTSKQYVNVRIDNNKGRISVKFSMICVRNYDDPTTMSLLYSRLETKSSTCNQYVQPASDTLFDRLENYLGGTIYQDDPIEYITENGNNYVLYSGKLWRAINRNPINKTVKLVSDDIVGMTTYNNKSSGKRNNFGDSNIYKWLNNIFLPTLRNPERYLVDAEWNTTALEYCGGSWDSPLTGGSTVISKVGLLNCFEYAYTSRMYLYKAPYWVISPSNANGNTTDNAWIITNSGGEEEDVSDFSGVMPSIVLKGTVTAEKGGTGTKENPFRVSGETISTTGARLNSRYPGEYVLLNGVKFRISSVNARYTKLISHGIIELSEEIINTIPNITSNDYIIYNGGTAIAYHFYDTTYSDNTFIGNYLKKWAEPIEDMLTEGDFCRKPVIKTEPQLGQCSSEYVFNSKIAIPNVNDLYVVGRYSAEFWTTSDPVNDKYTLIDGYNCSTREVSKNAKSHILPVAIVKNTVLISGGNGTENNPYQIYLNE